jgi:quinolinate synthase
LIHASLLDLRLDAPSPLLLVSSMPLLLEPSPAPLHELKPYKSLSNDALSARIEAVRSQLGPKLLILGHHYQQDEVIAHSDLRGDSYQLSQMAAASKDCRVIVFCGVHFMAETADILANRPEKLAERNGERVTVILPDMAAGCSMADMAAIDQVEAAWQDLGEVIDTNDVTPVTYINSAASLKAFCGRHGGIVCTSSNARAVLEWSFKRTQRVFFFPDQHLGRNTALKMGITNDQMPVFDPYNSDLGGNSEAAIAGSRVILWKGHCSVHQMFRAEHVQLFRQRFPGIKILVHPECPQEVNDQADVSGSTSKIIKTVEESPPGTKWAIGTELHLVNRLKHEHPEQEIHFLSPVVCMCATMYRIDLAHLCWSLENLAAGRPVNIIEVDDEIARWSLVALERMLEVK